MPSAPSHKIDDYETLLVALQSVLGVVVPDEQRSNFVERIEPLLSRYNFDSFALLADKLQTGDVEVRTDVLDAISHRQPDWLLSAEIKNILHNYIFAQLPKESRIWIVGCGQGQFAYSIAMELMNHEQKNGENKKYQIIATDVLQEDIDIALNASYSVKSLSTVSDDNKKMYVSLNAKEGYGKVKEKISNMISFSQFDITEDQQSLGSMDLIISPEVLMYFSNGVKASVLEQFTSLLKSGGIFLPGSSQIVPADLGLERVALEVGVFYRQKS